MRIFLTSTIIVVFNTNANSKHGQESVGRVLDNRTDRMTREMFQVQGSDGGGDRVAFYWRKRFFIFIFCEIVARAFLAWPTHTHDVIIDTTREPKSNNAGNGFRTVRQCFKNEIEIMTISRILIVRSFATSVPTPIYYIDNPAGSRVSSFVFTDISSYTSTERRFQRRPLKFAWTPHFEPKNKRIRSKRPECSATVTNVVVVPKSRPFVRTQEKISKEGGDFWKKCKAFIILC